MKVWVDLDMRRYLSLLLILSIVFPQNKVNVNNLIQYGDKWFTPNDDKPFNGIVFDLSKENGHKILQYKMKNGAKRRGKDERAYNKGHIELYSNFGFTTD